MAKVSPSDNKLQPEQATAGEPTPKSRFFVALLAVALVSTGTYVAASALDSDPDTGKGDAAQPAPDLTVSVHVYSHTADMGADGINKMRGLQPGQSMNLQVKLDDPSVVAAGEADSDSVSDSSSTSAGTSGSSSSSSNVAGNLRGADVTDEMRRVVLMNKDALTSTQKAQTKQEALAQHPEAALYKEVVAFHFDPAYLNFTTLLCDAAQRNTCEALQEGEDSKLFPAYMVLEYFKFKDAPDDIDMDIDIGIGEQPADGLAGDATGGHAAVDEESSAADIGADTGGAESDSAADGDRARRLAPFCALAAKKAGSCPSDFEEVCKKQHDDITWDIRNAAKALERAATYAQEKKLAKCLGIDPSNPKSYQECRGGGGGNGGLEDAFQHMLYTGLLYREIHTDTWGRGKDHSRNAALALMNAREQCMVDGSSSAWDAVMDMVNNEAGANIARDLTDTRCTFAIGYLFGSKCITRKEYPPSEHQLVDHLAKETLPTARAYAKTGKVPSSTAPYKSGNSPMFFHGSGITECFDDCDGHGSCKNHKCVCDAYYYGSFCGSHQPPPPPKRRRRRCFSGDAMVTVRDAATGAHVRTAMRDLAVGDHVLVGGRSTAGSGWEPVFAPVYLQGHADPAAVSDDFVCMRTATGAKLCQSPLHYIVADGKHTHAQDVRVGATVSVFHASNNSVASTSIVAVTRETRTGLYNPYTTTGYIVVDGVVSSVHSEWWLEDSAAVDAADIPAVYQAVLSPVRALYAASPAWLTRFDARIHGKADADADGTAQPRSLDEASVAEIVGAAAAAAVDTVRGS